MPDSPDRITASYVYSYSNELVVELTAVDEDGDIVVRSFQFEPEGERARAKTAVDDSLERHVASALESEGYEWAAD